MKIWIGMHTHRHGVSVYAFRSETSLLDFLKFLGEDFEDRDDEYVEIIESDLIEP